jgi:dihydroflavonol-4-reductase
MVGSMSIPHVQYPVVDVRDVAEAHLKAVQIEEAKGKRFILISENLWLVEIGEILNKKYGYYYNVNSTEVSKCM